MLYGLIRDYGYNDISKDRVKLAEAGVQSDLIYIENRKGIETLKKVISLMGKRDYIVTPSLTHLGDSIGHTQSILNQLQKRKLYVKALDLCIDTRKLDVSKIFGLSADLDRVYQESQKTQIKMQVKRLRKESYYKSLAEKKQIYNAYIKGVQHLRYRSGFVIAQLTKQFNKGARQIQRDIKDIRELTATSSVIL